MRSLRRLFAAYLAIAVLSACGGDGGGGPPPLNVAAASPPAGTTGVAYVGYTFTASGGTPPLSWTEAGSLPPGLTLSASGHLSGMPARAGEYPVSVKVTDSSMPPLTASASAALQITDSAIVIAPASPSPGTVTYPYAGFAFSASGGSPPYTWKASGTLPAGLILGSDGTLSGTPTQAGTFAFSVTATDSAQPPMSSSPLATQITASSPALLTPSPTPAPPTGAVGVPYGPFKFSATGGYLPLRWSVTAPSLPPGLTLGNDGSLSGTPTSVGSFAFTVTVTDSASTPVAKSLSVAISVTPTPPPPTIDNQEAPTGTVGSAYTPAYQFTASNGAPPLAWTETGTLPLGLGLSPSGVLSGMPTTAGQFPITLSVKDALKRAAPPAHTIVRVSLARTPAGFDLKGNLSVPRAGHSATLLLTGKVLVAGGANGAPDATAELYDPAAGTFSPTTGNMTQARVGHTAMLLALSSSAAPNYGKVLIVGSGDTTAELYDPATGTFAATGRLNHARTSPTATMLSTGKVLIVGGSTAADDLTAELYDPASGTFSYTGSTTVAHSGHTATLLLNGQVLIAGGAAAATAELYDPIAGKFTPTIGNMTEPHSGHTATLLGAADGVQSGHVLIIGVDGTAELYDPSTETFTRIGPLLSSMRPSYRHTASLLNDGTVLVAGGYNFFQVGACQVPTALGAAALFASESDGFTAPTGTLNVPRDTHTATVLQDGTVLVVGGIQQTGTQSGNPPQCVISNGILDQAEVFQTARPGSPPLNGNCLVGPAFGSPFCGIVSDSTQCPVGTPAIAPTYVSCGGASAVVDAARTCSVGNSRGQRRSGVCLIQ